MANGPASDFTLRFDDELLSSHGRSRLTVGGGANDDLEVMTWDPARLSFARGPDGWTVTDETGFGLRVNGITRTKWRIGNPHTISGHGALIEVVPDGRIRASGRQTDFALSGRRGRPPTLDDVPTGSFGPRQTGAIPAPSTISDPTAPPRFRPSSPSPSGPPTVRPKPRQAPIPQPLVAFDRHKSGPQRYIVGRSIESQVVVDDLRVAPRHAEIRIDGNNGASVVDLGSRGGTYVDGRRITGDTRVRSGQTVSFGSTRLRVREQNGQIQLVDVSEQLSIAADSVKIVIGGKEIVRSATLRADPGDLIAVLGPSGSGKSTLVRSLSGGRAPSSGSITVNGESPYTEGSTLRQQLGYVPQDDILHDQLTISLALAYTADLRFPDSTADSERQQRVAAVIAELGLTNDADNAIHNLSGGQRKRVNVATELLTAPSLLFLDEPTSGLDPGYEKEVMLLLRQLADGGRTVMVVTHSMQSLDVCDHLLIMARDGQQAFFGPPKEALQYFRVDSLADVFIQLERDNRDWQAAWEAVAAPTALLTAPQIRPRPIAYRSVWAQFTTLLQRYVNVLSSDRRQLTLTFAQGPLIALLMILVMGSDELAGSRDGRSMAAQVLLAMTLGAVYVGLSGAVREVVKELPILRRERAAGIAFGPYVLSKLVVLGAITVAQAVILVALGASRQNAPVDANVLYDGRLELVVAVAMTGLSSVALGLFISTIAKEQDKAMLILPIVLFAQFVLSGVSFAVDHPALQPLSALMPARWGFAAVASTVDLPRLNGNCRERSYGCPENWSEGADVWIESMSFLGFLTVLYLAGAIGMLMWRESSNQL